ncbi:TPA: restriction endonuclease subunit S, partial [Campylobacter coli]|nr:restriction endonuclease subunit S [Campylobacter coli]
MKIKIWKINKLEKICEILDNKRVPISQKDRISGIYPYYGASGIVDY